MTNHPKQPSTLQPADAKPVIIELLNQRLSNRELAEALNQRQLYMLSGASWNAGRVGMFLAKHQITSAANPQDHSFS